MEKTDQLTKGSLYPLYAQYLLTSIGGMLGQALYVLGDTMIVGHSLGTPGLAALNIAIPVINFMAGIGLLLGIGGATALSVDKGRGDTETGNSFFTFSFLSALMIGLVIVLARLFFLQDVSMMLGANQDTLENTMAYLGTFLWFSPLFILNMTMTIFVRNDGAPRLAMISMLAGSFVNIFLDYILMIKMNLGMAGGAFATGVAPVVGLLVLSIHGVKGKGTLRLAGIPVKKIKEFGIRIVSNGASSFIIELSAGIVIIAFNKALLRLEGTQAVSSYSIIANLSLIAAAIFTGISQAIQPLISVNFGAGLDRRTLETVRLGIWTALLFGVVFLGAGYLYADPLMRLFVSDPGPIAEITRRGMHLYFLSFLLMGVNMVLASFKQSKERVRGSLIISLSRGLVLVLLFLFLLPKWIGTDGVWLTMPIAELGTFILSIIGLKESRRAMIFLVQGDKM